MLFHVWVVKSAFVLSQLVLVITILLLVRTDSTHWSALGLTNTVTAIKNAQMAESPLLLLGGCAANLSKGRGALQDIDHMSLFQSICKYTVSIKRVRQIPFLLRRAIFLAQSGTPGNIPNERQAWWKNACCPNLSAQDPSSSNFPLMFCILSIWLNVKWESNRIQKHLLIDLPICTARDRAVGTNESIHVFIFRYLSTFIRGTFAGAFEEQCLSPIPPTTPYATNITSTIMPTKWKDLSEDLCFLLTVQKAAELVRKAKSPVCLLGSQSTLPPTSTHDVVEALEVHLHRSKEIPTHRFLLSSLSHWIFRVFSVAWHEAYWVETVRFSFVIAARKHWKEQTLFSSSVGH